MVKRLLIAVAFVWTHEKKMMFSQRGVCWKLSNRNELGPRMIRIIDAFTEDGSWGNDNVFATKGTRLNQADALVRDPPIYL
jgi:hypothetical protein